MAETKGQPSAAKLAAAGVMAGPVPATKQRKPRAAVDPNESKADKFRRLGRKRLTRAVKAIKGLEALGRGNAYEYTTEQANKVVQTLVDAVSAVKVAFGPRQSKSGQELIDL